MGYSTAYGFAESTDLRQGISIHFSSNCYPPVPQSMVETARSAIIAVADGDIDREIDLPSGVSWRDQSTVPAHEAVNGLHLEAFVSYLIDGRGLPD